MAKARKTFYDPEALEDAPEHHQLARSLGTLTWGTWDPTPRPVEERIADFRATYPPDDPVRRVHGWLKRMPDGSVAPSTSAARLEVFLRTDWRPGSLYELAARFGLRFRGSPPRVERPFEPEDMKETARKRNVRLRVLHGGVDIEPTDMDAAKAALLEKQEKERAAADVRAARQRMAEELGKKDNRTR